MPTEILTGEIAVDRAVQLLRDGGVVALPTETVYGLAGDALNDAALVKIFAVKARPTFDPLIVHLPHNDWLGRVAKFSTLEQKIIGSLIGRFWPGPLTIVLKKTEMISDLAVAGLDTVAVRRSANPIFCAVIEKFARPLAAPSANRFGRISPTTAQAVREELDIPLVVDGGRTTHGIESTVVQLVGGALEILRPGPVTSEMLVEFAPVKLAPGGRPISSPGQLLSHYSPRTKMQIVARVAKTPDHSGGRVGALLFGPIETLGFTATRQLSLRRDLGEAAANLFQSMRELDGEGLDLIVAEFVPEIGLGVAINDRLRRAASFDKTERVG